MNEKMLLGNEKIGILLIKYLTPSVVGLIVIALYGIIDGMFIGIGVGRDGLAAINIGYPIINLANALALMLGVGGATLISIYTKTKKFKNACFSYLIYLNIFFYISIIFIVFTFRDSLIKFMGATPYLTSYVKSYLYPTAGGVIFIMLSTSLSIIVRNNGSPAYAFFSMIIGAIINIFLDWLLVIKFNYGLSGAAFATITGQFFTFILLTIYFYKRKNEFQLINKYFNSIILFKIFSIGFSSFIIEFAIAFIIVIFNRVFMKYGGEIAVAAYSVVGYIFYMFRMIYAGIAQGIQPIISYNFGIGNTKRMIKTYFLAHKISFVISILNLFVINIFSEKIVSLFSRDQELIKLAIEGNKIYSIAVLFVGINLINTMYLQSKNSPKYAIAISMSRSVIFIIIYIIILPPIFKIKGIWLAFPLADITTTLFTYIFRKKINFYQKRWGYIPHLFIIFSFRKFNAIIVLASSISKILISSNGISKTSTNSFSSRCCSVLIKSEA